MWLAIAGILAMTSLSDSATLAECQSVADRTTKRPLLKLSRGLAFPEASLHGGSTRFYFASWP